MKKGWLGFGLAFALVASAFGCSVGKGEGELRSERLFAEGCHDGPFDLQPDFFGAQPYRDTLNIRIQRGADLDELSDGLKVLVTDIPRVEDHLGIPLQVGLPPSVTPPGIPITANPDPPIVHATLYLHRSCHEQNIALYAISGTITFHAIFNGDPSETKSKHRLTEAELSIVVADPRDMPPSGEPIPEDRTSLLEGRFRFYFERGQPAQPFP